MIFTYEKISSELITITKVSTNLENRVVALEKLESKAD